MHTKQKKKECDFFTLLLYSNTNKRLIYEPVCSCLEKYTAIFNLAFFHVWEGLSDEVENWNDTETDKSFLTISDIICLSVAEERHWDASLSLRITLRPELFVEEIRPLDGDVPVPKTGADVTGVQQN